MSKCFFSVLLVLLACVISFGQQNFFWQNPQPQGNDFNDVQFIDANTAFAVCNGGVVLKTVDGGITWTSKDISTAGSWMLTKTFFLNSQVGFVVGYVSTTGLFFKTTDGGATWVRTTSAALTTLRSVFFRSTSLGWTVAGDGKVAKTTDGGATWTNKTSGLTTQLNEVYFSSDLVGFIFGAGGVIKKTTDGGDTWTALTSNVTDIYAVQFVTPTMAIAVGAAGCIAKSTDGGDTWTKMTSPSSSANYVDVFFVNQNTGFAYRDAATSSASVYRTTDGGTTWSNPMMTSPQVGATRIWFFSETTGFAFGRKGGVSKTTDGGVNWTTPTRYTNTVKDIFFINQSLGWAVAFDNSGSFFAKTTDGGKSWTFNTSVFSKPYSVYFLNERLGWVSTDMGGMGKTTDGGNTWTSQTLPQMDHMYDVFFVDSLYGWSVGSNYTYRSTDGGTTWTQILSGGSYSGGNHIYFLDRNKGFKDTYQSNYTTDGGTTWQNIATFTMSQASFTFANNNIGWAVYGQNVSKTTDGGLTWTVKSLNNVGFYAASCSDSLTCWATGSAGCLYQTTDGGTTWNRVLAHTGLDCYAICAKGGNLWYGGANGTILSTISPLTAIEEHAVQRNASEYILCQNYPNPFNPTTTINYQIPKNSMVTLKIYDMLGSEVQTLLSEEQSAGKHSAVFNAAPFASGVYFYTLRAGDFVTTKKLMLVK